MTAFKVRATLARYLRLGLMPRIGKVSKWTLEVAAVVKALANESLATMDRDECLTVMWMVFTESRRFFSYRWRPHKTAEIHAATKPQVSAVFKAMRV